MAFITKNSKAFVQLKFGRLYSQNIVSRHAVQSKISMCFNNKESQRHHHYSSYSSKTLLLYPIGKCSIRTSPFSISSRYMSSDSNEKLQVFITEPLNKDLAVTNTIAGSSSDKVLFVETPQVAETPPPYVDPVVSQAAESSEFISDATANLAMTSDMPSIAAAVAEPSLSSLGLIHWTPVGLVEACLEFLHVNVGMPWWLTIVTATLIARALMLPIFVIAQRNASRVANYMPEMQFLQAKFTEARKTGNAYEASKTSQELLDFMEKNNVNPLKNAMIPLAQAPVFISYFFALRAMAKVPVPSMQTGGLWWITDLTIPDPYYIMPIVASTTLYVILKVGAESGMRMDDLKLSRYILMAMPVVVFPFIINFESAVLFYWCTNNFVSLGLAVMMKIEAVRKYFGIQKVKPPPAIFKKDKKGFIEGIKESVDNQRILKSMEDRRRIDQVQFQKAGTGPIPRTYRYNPTKLRPASAAAAAARQKQTKA